ncbi:hypothetical protein TNCV_2798761 [Trichonephila clavipes]|nr:hypothetical protein TNCV_2798761 [Trichonephila clavipes]
MLNGDKIGTSMQAESDPVDEKRMETRTATTEVAKFHQMLRRKEGVQWWSQWNGVRSQLIRKIDVLLYTVFDATFDLAYTPVDG